MQKTLLCTECAELKARLAVSLEENKKLHEEVKNYRLKDEMDYLTGEVINNRKGFDKAWGREVDNSLRYGEPLSIAICDLDDFKGINDTFGHPVGDSMLTKMAILLRKYCRKTDSVARLGGDEFCIILSHTNCTTAHTFIERLRKTLKKELKVITKRGETVRCSVSFGVGQFQKDQTAKECFDMVDRSLLNAKRGGRDRVASVS